MLENVEMIDVENVCCGCFICSILNLFYMRMCMCMCMVAQYIQYMLYVICYVRIDGTWKEPGPLPVLLCMHAYLRGLRQFGVEA